MDMIESIEDWYSSVCNGDWEHTFGISIATIDNPGWMVSIDLVDTPLESHNFNAIARETNDRDWIRCWIDKVVFKGYGGTHNLREIISVFTEWASNAE